MSLLERGVEFVGKLVEHKPVRLTAGWSLFKEEVEGAEDEEAVDEEAVGTAAEHEEAVDEAAVGADPPSCRPPPFLPPIFLPASRLPSSASPLPPNLWHDHHAAIANPEERQRNLDRMKRRATGLLVLMAAVFVVTSLFEARHPWLGYIRATAEASMVGGIADWFAITALFRHPLNIPIPHTAIIPNRKDRIGRSLGNFVQHNFLSPEVLSAKLKAAEISRRAAEWLSDIEHAKTAARQAGSALRGAGTVVRDEDVHALLDRSVVEPLRRMPIAPVLARGTGVADDRRPASAAARPGDPRPHRLVAENESLIRERIREESPWWVPEMVDERIHKGAGRDRADAVRGRHRSRSSAPAPVRRSPRRLDRSAPGLARSDRAGRGDQAADARSRDQRPAGRVALGGTEAGPRPEDTRITTGHRAASARGLSALATAALEDQALLEKIDGWVIAAVLRVVEQHRHEVGQLIAQTVSAWDPDETSRRIELQVGRDLQFIRINGTLVGGLVGLLIYTATHAF